MHGRTTCLHGDARVVSGFLLKAIQHIVHVDVLYSLLFLPLCLDPAVPSETRNGRHAGGEERRWKGRQREKTTLTMPNNSATPHPCTPQSPTSSESSSSQVPVLDTRTQSLSVSPRGQPTSWPRWPATLGNHSRNARRTGRGRGFQ